MDKDFIELIRMMQNQYKLALAGERPVFCDHCKRPYRARLASGGIFPYRHACKTSRETCTGSHTLAVLTP